MKRRTKFYMTVVSAAMFASVVDGKQVVVIIENGKSKIYETTIAQIIKENAARYGTSFHGTKASVKEIIGNTHLVPIIYMDTIWFPTVAPNRSDCVWLAYHHIIKIGDMEEGKTPVTLTGGVTLYLDVKKASLMKRVGTISFWKDQLEGRKEQMKQGMKQEKNYLVIIKESNTVYYVQKNNE